MRQASVSWGRHAERLQPEAQVSGHITYVALPSFHNGPALDCDAGCSGLSECLWYLNTGSSLSGTVWGSLGSVALLEEEHHLGGM